MTSVEASIARQPASPRRNSGSRSTISTRIGRRNGIGASMPVPPPPTSAELRTGTTFRTSSARKACIRSGTGAGTRSSTCVRRIASTSDGARSFGTTTSASIASSQACHRASLTVGSRITAPSCRFVADTEQRTQPLDRPVVRHVDRRTPLAERLGDLLRRKPGEAELDDLPLTGGQARKQIEHEAHLGIRERHIVGSGNGGLVRRGIEHDEGSSYPNLVDDGVVGNREEPGAKPASPVGA